MEGRPSAQGEDQATVDVVFAEDTRRDRLQRSANESSASTAARSSVRCGSGLLPPTETLSMRIAMIVQVPMSVQRHSLSPTRNVPPIAKSPCVIVYLLMIGVSWSIDAETDNSCRVAGRHHLACRRASLGHRPQPSRHFDQSVSSRQRRQHSWQHRLDPDEQITSPRIRQPDRGDKRPVATQRLALREILVLRNDDRGLRQRVFPDRGIGRSLHSQVADMGRLVHPTRRAT